MIAIVHEDVQLALFQDILPESANVGMSEVFDDGAFVELIIQFTRVSRIDLYLFHDEGLSILQISYLVHGSKRSFAQLGLNFKVFHFASLVLALTLLAVWVLGLSVLTHCYGVIQLSIYYKCRKNKLKI